VCLFWNSTAMMMRIAIYIYIKLSIDFPLAQSSEVLSQIVWDQRIIHFNLQMKHASTTINYSNYLYSVQTWHCTWSHINDL